MLQIYNLVWQNRGTRRRISRLIRFRSYMCRIMRRHLSRRIHELNSMYMTRLSYVECPVCKKKIEHRSVKIPNKSKLSLINKEIQCPMCESRLIMDIGSQKRFKLFFIFAFICLPFLLVALADLLKLLSILSNFQIKIGIIVVVAALGYLFYTVFSIQYVPKKQSGS